MDAAKSKKKPGRPKKMPINTELAINGIVNEPKDNEDNDNPRIIEFIYHNPALIKKILQIAKNLCSAEVHIKFDKTEILFYAKSHVEKNKMLTKIHGTKVNRYYCHTPMTIKMELAVVHKVLQQISTDITMIEFYILEKSKDTKIFLTTTNNDIGMYNVIDLTIAPSDYLWEIKESIEQNNTYCIRFELPSKLLRSKICSLKADASQITIEKNGNEPLKVYSQYKDSHTEDILYFISDEKIKLYSTVPETSIIAVSVFLEDITVPACSVISDKITIHVDKIRPIIFSYLLDVYELAGAKNINQAGSETAQMYIMTDIITTV